MTDTHFKTDNNLFDAILLKTRRIGHGFSLYKHPKLIDMVKEKQILIESCPISNEVLRYSASIMSHPLPALLARGVKASLSNDDPRYVSPFCLLLMHPPTSHPQAIDGSLNIKANTNKKNSSMMGQNSATLTYDFENKSNLSR